MNQNIQSTFLSLVAEEFSRYRFRIKLSPGCLVVLAPWRNVSSCLCGLSEVMNPEDEEKKKIYDWICKISALELDFGIEKLKEYGHKFTGFGYSLPIIERKIRILSDLEDEAEEDGEDVAINFCFGLAIGVGDILYENKSTQIGVVSHFWQGNISEYPTYEIKEKGITIFDGENDDYPITEMFVPLNADTQDIDNMLETFLTQYFPGIFESLVSKIERVA